MHFWRVSMLAIWLASGGASFAQTPQPVGTGVPRPATPSPAPAELPYVTRKPVVNIPLDLHDTLAGGPVSVQVFFSVDAGRTWRKYKVVDVAPDKQQFLEFRPPQDGEYCLAAVRLNHTRDPSFSLAQLTPQKRIVFDTRRPKLVLSAEAAPNGEILVTWQATDERLDPTTFHLEYRAGDAESEWLPLEIDPRDVTSIDNGLEGRARFHPPATARLVNIRAEVRDQATNPCTVERVVALPKSTMGFPQANSAKTLTPIEADAIASPKSTVDLTPRQLPNNLGGNPTPAKPRANPLPRDAAQQRIGGGTFGEPPILDKPGPGRFAAFPTERQDPEPASSQLPSVPPAVEAASTPDPPEPDPYADQPRLLNKKRFNLDYDVESVGVAGVADVELWGTSDRGQTWMKWGADPDLKSPLEVDVSSEAIYGFRIVVVSRNGLTSRPPQTGDPADVWVQVDATPPQCRLASVTYGQGEDAGKLDIRWDASDAHLAERPATILMSDRPDAGYSVIAAGLPNTGQYLWPYDPRAPQQIYLRLEVRDEAGNVGFDQLTEPIRVEGLTPKGRIRSVAPIETGQRSPFRAKLFK